MGEVDSKILLRLPTMFGLSLGSLLELRFRLVRWIRSKGYVVSRTDWDNESPSHRSTWTRTDRRWHKTWEAAERQKQQGCKTS